jgi:uncharacterized protein VirK/YbjX
MMLWAGVTVATCMTGPYFFDAPVIMSIYEAMLEMWPTARLTARWMVNDLLMQHDWAPTHFNFTAANFWMNICQATGHSSQTAPAPLPYLQCSLCGLDQKKGRCILLLYHWRVVPSCGRGLHCHYSTADAWNVMQDTASHWIVFWVWRPTY